MHVALPTLALLLLAALAPSASAQDTVTIYRCTDAAGNLTVQNGTPCPAGSTQTVRTLGGVSTASSPTATPVVRPLVAAPSAPGEAAPRVPSAAVVAPLAVPGVIPATTQPLPPALYECRAVGGGVVWADAPDPAERCAGLLTAGNGVCDVDLSTPCPSVAPSALCERWEQRLRTLELGSGLAASLTTRAEIARAQAVVTGSSCALTR